MKGTYEICDWLIDQFIYHELTLLGKDDRGYTPYMLAAIYGYHKKKRQRLDLGEKDFSKRYLIVKSFVIKSKKIDFGQGENRANPLHWACYHHDKD